MFIFISILAFIVVLINLTIQAKILKRYQPYLRIVSILIICFVFIGAYNNSITLANTKSNYNKTESNQTNDLIDFKNKYSIYEPYGLEIKGNKLFYSDKEIRWFIDRNGSDTIISTFYNSTTDSLIDVETVREGGKLKALRQCTQKEYNQRYDNSASSKYFPQFHYPNDPDNIRYKISTMYEINFPQTDKNMFYEYNEGNNFTYNSKNKTWEFNNKPLKMFYDDVSSDIINMYFNNSENALNNGISIKIVINDDKKEFAELTQAELNNIYNNKAFGGLGGLFYTPESNKS